MRLLEFSKENPMQEKTDSMAWLEEVSNEVKIDKNFGEYSCQVSFGEWSKLYLRVGANGRDIASAADNCAEKVKGLMRDGTITLQT